MPDKPQEILQTPALGDAALFAEEAAILRAADAWQVEGISVWEAVKVQIAAEMPPPSPFHADALRQSIYEIAGMPQKPTDAMATPAAEDAVAELIALVRDLQSEVRELKQEVQGLKKQFAAQQLAPTPYARPATYPAPSAFQMRPTAQTQPLPLFRD